MDSREPRVRIEVVANDPDDADDEVRQLREDLADAGVEVEATRSDVPAPQGSKGVSPLLLDAVIGGSMHVAFAAVLEQFYDRHRHRATVRLVSPDGKMSIDLSEIPDERRVERVTQLLEGIS